jgi:hypothetical protein
MLKKYTPGIAGICDYYLGRMYLAEAVEHECDADEPISSSIAARFPEPLMVFLYWESL